MLSFLRDIADRYNVSAVKIQFMLVGAGVLLLAVSTTLSILKVRDEYRETLSDYSTALLFATQIDFEVSKFMNAWDRWEDVAATDPRHKERQKMLLEQHKLLSDRFPALRHGMETTWSDSYGVVGLALENLEKQIAEFGAVYRVNDHAVHGVFKKIRTEIVSSLAPIRDLLERNRAGGTAASLFGRQDRVEPFFADMLLYTTGAFAGGIFLIFILVRQIKLTHRSAAALDSARREMDVAKREAEDANRAKSYFLAVMSHEIRTPMNGVLGTASLLSDGTLSDQQREYVQTIQRSGESLLTILNDILDFSKLEAGHIDLETVSYNPSEVSEEVAMLFARQANEKGIELAVEIDPEVPAAILGDSGRVRQILLNLVGNAVKFTEAGGVTVRLTADRNFLKFSVRDTGVGVPEENRDSLFREFAQGDASVTRKYGGTGLGLAICRRLVEFMNGQIKYVPKADDGGGSEFWFQLRSVPDPGARTGRMEIESYPGKKAVLLADNPVLAANLRHHMELAGLTVLCEKDPGWFIDLCTGENPDVLIVDSQIAGLSLRDISRKLKQASETYLPRTVIALGAVSKTNSADIAPLGFECSIRKPFRRREIAAALRQAILGEKVEPTIDAPASRFRDPEWGPGARILLAEDGAINRKVATVMLERAGYTVEGVEDGAAALIAVEANDFDLVLMDLHMPDVDGFAATAAIRAMEGAKGKIPIVALTANALLDSRQACLEAGMDEFITKPIDRESILRTIAAVLRKSGVSAGALPSAEDVAEAGAATGETAVPSRVIDQTILEQFRLDVSDDNLIMLLDEFRAEAVKLIGQVNAAIEGKAFNSAGRFSHSLKSSAGTIGAVDLESISGRMESACFDRREDEIDATIDDLENSVTRAVAAVDAIIERSEDQPAGRRARG